MERTVQDERTYAYTGGKPFNAELPCVVLMHGAQNDHSIWGLQTRWFVHHGFNVLAVDLSEHGRSGGAPLEIVEAMVDWVMALVHAAGVIQPVIVVGHSMGSPTALECASRYADCVRRIALVATVWPMKVSDVLLGVALNNTANAIEMVNTWSHSSLANKPSSPEPGFWMHGGSQRLMERVACGIEAPVFHTDFAAYNAYAYDAEAMASVKCLSLVIVGEKDQVTPAKAGHHVAAGLAGNHVVGLPGGRAIMGECPNGTLNALIVLAREQDAVAA